MWYVEINESNIHLKIVTVDTKSLRGYLEFNTNSIDSRCGIMSIPSENNLDSHF